MDMGIGLVGPNFTDVCMLRGGGGGEGDLPPAYKRV